MARGVTIPKPGEDDYSKSKRYRVISLLNCLGKVTEKVVAAMKSENCNREGTLHPGQYGSCKRKSAADAVGVLMTEVQQAWRCNGSAGRRPPRVTDRLGQGWDLDGWNRQWVDRFWSLTVVYVR